MPLVVNSALPEVRLFTDGSCNPNPGPGGWAAILQWGDEERELSGGELATTNNRMEMQGVLQGLLALKFPCAVVVTTDSQYVIKGMTEWVDGWVRRRWRTSSGDPVKNADLWPDLMAAAERHTIEWVWVKGHRGHPENERADALADQARLRTIDEG